MRAKGGKYYNVTNIDGFHWTIAAAVINFSFQEQFDEQADSNKSLGSCPATFLVYCCTTVFKLLMIQSVKTCQLLLEQLLTYFN